MKKIISMVIVLALCLSFAPAAFASEAPIQVRLATLDADDSTLSMYVKTFMDAVDEILPGRFEWSLYSNGSLGNERELGEQVMSHQIQGAVVACSVMSSVAPLTTPALQDAMFMFSGVDDMYRVLNDGYREYLDEDYEQYGFVNMGYIFAGSQEIENNSHVVKVPSDMADLKIRCYESAPIFAFLDGVGAMGVTMAWSDLFTALEQGTLDGIYTSVSSFGLGGHLAEAGTYHTILNATTTGYGFTFDKSWFDTLPEDAQAAMREAASVAEDWMQNEWAPDQYDKDMEFILDNGVEVYEPTEEEYAEWVDAARTYCWSYIEEAVGEDLWAKALEWSGQAE